MTFSRHSIVRCNIARARRGIGAEGTRQVASSHEIIASARILRKTKRGTAESSILRAAEIIPHTLDCSVPGMTPAPALLMGRHVLVIRQCSYTRSLAQVKVTVGEDILCGGRSDGQLSGVKTPVLVQRLWRWVLPCLCVLPRRRLKPVCGPTVSPRLLTIQQRPLITVNICLSPQHSNLFLSASSHNMPPCGTSPYGTSPCGLCCRALHARFFSSLLPSLALQEEGHHRSAASSWLSSWSCVSLSMRLLCVFRSPCAVPKSSGVQFSTQLTAANKYELPLTHISALGGAIVSVCSPPHHITPVFHIDPRASGGACSTCTVWFPCVGDFTSNDDLDSKSVFAYRAAFCLSEDVRKWPSTSLPRHSSVLDLRWCVPLPLHSSFVMQPAAASCYLFSLLASVFSRPWAYRSPPQCRSPPYPAGPSGLHIFSSSCFPLLSSACAAKHCIYSLSICSRLRNFPLKLLWTKTCSWTKTWVCPLVAPAYLRFRVSHTTSHVFSHLCTFSLFKSSTLPTSSSQWLSSSFSSLLSSFECPTPRCRLHFFSVVLSSTSCRRGIFPSSSSSMYASPSNGNNHTSKRTFVTAGASVCRGFAARDPSAGNIHPSFETSLEKAFIQKADSALESSLYYPEEDTSLLSTTTPSSFIMQHQEKQAIDTHDEEEEEEDEDPAAIAGASSALFYEQYPQFPGDAVTDYSNKDACKQSSTAFHVPPISPSSSSSSSFSSSFSSSLSFPTTSRAFSPQPKNWRFASREDEKKVLQTLSEISQYTEDTKLSLKIYHLQELSHAGLAYAELSCDNRFRQLAHDIYKNTRLLSPAQLHALAVVCRNLQLPGTDGMWKVLAKEIVRHVRSAVPVTRGISLSQVCHAMSCFARQQADVTQELKAMLSYLLQGACHLNERDIVCVLYTLRRYSSEAPGSGGASAWPYLRVLRVCAWAAEQKIQHMRPQYLSYILYEFSRIGVIPYRLAYKANNILRQAVETLPTRALVLYALMTARTRCLVDMQLLRRVGRRAAAAADTRTSLLLSNRSAVLLLYCYARLDNRNKAIVTLCCDRIKRAVSTFEDIAIAQLCYSLGRLGIRDEEVWERLATTTISRINSLLPAEIASVLHAFGKVGIFHQGLVLAATEHILARLHDLYVVLLENFLRRGAEQDARGINQLRRLMFSILLEFPSFLETAASHAVRLLAEQHQQPFLQQTEQGYHRELEDCFRKLGLDGKVLQSKGPYTFDVKFKATRDREVRKPKVYVVDFLSDGYYCPITGELLGMGRMKKRHVDLFGWTYLHIRRKEWLKLKTQDNKIRALSQLLHPVIGDVGLNCASGSCNA